MQCSAMQCNPMQWNGMYVRTYVCVYVRVYAWMNVWMYACMHVCVYAYNVPSGNQTWLSMRILNKLPCKASNHPEVWDFSTKPCCIAKGYIHIYILCIYIYFNFLRIWLRKKHPKVHRCHGSHWPFRAGLRAARLKKLPTQTMVVMTVLCDTGC